MASSSERFHQARGQIAEIGLAAVSKRAYHNFNAQPNLLVKKHSSLYYMYSLSYHLVNSCSLQHVGNCCKSFPPGPNFGCEWATPSTT